MYARLGGKPDMDGANPLSPFHGIAGEKPPRYFCIEIFTHSKRVRTN